MIVFMLRLVLETGTDMFLEYYITVYTKVLKLNAVG